MASMSNPHLTSHRQIRIVEVGPRDGLQNEKVFVPTEVKSELIKRLHLCGLKHIEITSFVSAKWVPQMSDNSALCERIHQDWFHQGDCQFIALTPNLQGLNEALRMNKLTSGHLPNAVAIFASASEGFSKANINCSILESLKRFEPLMKTALDKKIPVRGYISCAIACPYDGPTKPEQVAKLAVQLKSMGCYEISLGDTIGAGNPESTYAMLKAVLDHIPAHEVAMHFHDTGGRALDNIDVGLKLGIHTIDCSVGGLGGCPYAGDGASGNVSTESVIQRLHDAGYSTGVDLAKLRETAVWIRGLIQSSKKP